MLYFLIPSLFFSRDRPFGAPTVLRVYDRGSIVQKKTSFKVHLLHELTGHKNRSWPIKSAFYVGSCCLCFFFCTHFVTPWVLGARA